MNSKHLAIVTLGLCLTTPAFAQDVTYPDDFNKTIGELRQCLETTMRTASLASTSLSLAV